VTQVVPNSVASKLGFQKDDVILEFNGEAVPTLAALASKIRDVGEGSAASLRIRRNGTEFYQGVQLGGLSK
jgi:S1-C subfamily serine protease